MISFGCDRREVGRGTCFACFKAPDFCLCDEWRASGQVSNRTAITIVQHPRERNHPLGTVRIARLGLAHCRVVCVGPKEPEAIARTQAAVDDLVKEGSVALLYPGPGSTDLTELDEPDFPQSMVVLDGTWHHTKTLLRDIAPLQHLPRVHIQPREASQYRIRREPNRQSLSTIEAIVQALEIIEPHTVGLQRLRRCFNGMIDRQIAAGDKNPAPRFPQRSLARTNVEEIVQ